LLALDPHFKEGDIAELAKDLEDNARRIAKEAEKELEKEERQRSAGGLGSLGGDALGGAFGEALGGIGILLPGVLGSTVGNPAERHVRYAEELRSKLPNSLLDAAHDRSDNVLHLILALLLHPDTEERSVQVNLLQQQMGKDRTEEITNYFTQVQALGDQFRLPLLDLSFPALKRRPRDQIEFLRSQVNRIITTDNKVEPFEYVLSRVLASHLVDAWQPYARAKKLSKADDIESALRHVFAVVSLEGSHDNKVNAEADLAGINYLVEHPNSKALLGKIKVENIKQYQQPGKDWIVEMDEALLGFDAMNLKVKRALIEALSVTISFDQQVSQTESELLRAICSTFHCPLPPIVQTEGSAVQ